MKTRMQVVAILAAILVALQGVLPTVTSAAEGVKAPQVTGGDSRMDTALEGLKERVREVGAAVKNAVGIDYSKQEQDILRQLEANPTDFNTQHRLIDVAYAHASSIEKGLVEYTKSDLTGAQERAVQTLSGLSADLKKDAEDFAAKSANASGPTKQKYAELGQRAERLGRAYDIMSAQIGQLEIKQSLIQAQAAKEYVQDVKKMLKRLQEALRTIGRSVEMLNEIKQLLSEVDQLHATVLGFADTVWEGVNRAGSTTKAKAASDQNASPGPAASKTEPAAARAEKL